MHGDYLPKEITDTKICKSCKEKKPLIKFRCFKKMEGGIRSLSNRVSFNYSRKCFNCYGGTKLINVPFYDEVKKEWFKRCKPCQKIKPVKVFKIVKGKPSYCNPCYYYLFTRKTKARRVENGKDGEYNRKRYANSPEIRKKESIRKQKYRRSLTPEQKKAERKRKYKYDLMSRAIKKGSPFAVLFTKEDIIKRDGLVCYLCGKLLIEKEAEMEHIIPLIRGGSHKPENVKIACGYCNRSKGNKTLTEFKKYRGDYSRFQKQISLN